MPSLNILSYPIKKQQQSKYHENFKNNVQNRFARQVKLIVDKYNLEEIVLVATVGTALIISNLFKVQELVEMKILYLERLDKKRKRMSSNHAIYFIQPTQKCIDLLKKDFPENSQDIKQKRQYKKIHVLFTSSISQSLITEIALHKPLLKRIATNSIKQFYYSSTCFDSNVINFSVQKYGKEAYSKEPNRQKQLRAKIADKLMQIVANMGQINCVRIYYRKSPNCIAQMVAEYAQKSISKYLAKLVESGSMMVKDSADDIIIFIIDRSFDPLTPLLHYYSYEASLFDLLKVTFEGQIQDEQNVSSIKSQKQRKQKSALKQKRSEKQNKHSEQAKRVKEVQFEDNNSQERIESKKKLKKKTQTKQITDEQKQNNEQQKSQGNNSQSDNVPSLKKIQLKKQFQNIKTQSKPTDKQSYQFSQFYDEIYQMFRYKHITEALRQVPEILNIYNGKLEAIKDVSSRKQEKNIDVIELKQKISMLSKQIEVIDNVYGQIKEKDLLEISQLELSIATGLHQDGKNTSSYQLVEQVVQIIAKNQKLSQDQKLRLALITVCGIKLSKKDYQKLIESFSDESDRKAIKNMAAFGKTYDPQLRKSTKDISKAFQNLALQRIKKTGIPLDRYTSVIELLVPKIYQTLSSSQKNYRGDKSLDETFGLVKCSFSDNQQMDIIKFSKNRLCFAIVGGLSFAQLSAIKSFSEEKNILITADDLISPKKYVEMLKNINILT